MATSRARRDTRSQQHSVENASRKRFSRRQNEPTADAEKAPHIDLRVVRHAKVDDTALTYEWHEFLGALGNKNHHLGTARSLGSVAMTYVPAVIMNEMLRKKQSKDFYDRKRKPKMFRKVAEGINNFLRESSKTAFDVSVECQKVVILDEIAPENERWIGPQDNTYIDLEEEINLFLSPEEKLIRASEYPYGEATMAVRGLKLYDNKYGLDHSLDERPYDERNGIKAYLQTCEGLDTSMLERYWEAKSSVFELHDHVGAAVLKYTAGLMPLEIVYNAPTVEHHVILRGVNE